MISKIPTTRRLSGRRGSTLRILQIGNYPPPVCGWAIQTKLLVEEIRRRGHACDVLNINESRKKKSSEYIDVQNGADYVYKLMRFASRGYRFQIHVNGQSKPGYTLAILAALVGRIFGQPTILSWQGGLQQKYFPRHEDRGAKWAYRQLFRLAGKICCNSAPIKSAIESYGIPAHRVEAIPAFSQQNLAFTPVQLPLEAEAFLQAKRPVFFCYVSFRPEYDLPMLRKAMSAFRESHPGAGFVWLGFPSKETAAAKAYVDEWPRSERDGLLLLGNLTHDEFLTLLGRCFAYIRTPMCDGVAASILESLSLGVPVVASENGTRPNGVITYRHDDVSDLHAKLAMLVDEYARFKEEARLDQSEDNIVRTVDWVLDEVSVQPLQGREEWAHVR